MPASGICEERIPLIVATLACSLAADVWTDIVGQAVVSVGIWVVLFYLLNRVERDLRFGLMACLVIATAGELLLSLLWGLYTYRLSNIPPFVPPGHVLLLLLGLSLARHLSESAAHWIIGCAGIYSLAAVAAGVDTLALPLFLVLGAASLAMPTQRRLYASTFVLSLVLELYGTWLGNWIWMREVPGMALVTTNPPVVAGAFYCALDALVGAASLLLVPKLIAWGTRSNADRFGLPRANLPAEYRDSGRFGVRAEFPAGADGKPRVLRFVGRESAGVDYWEGG